MVKGAAWMVSFKLVERSLGLISTIVLARLLVPADFGIVAMASSTIAVLSLLGAFSLDVVLIQKQDATRDHYNTAWTLKMLTNTLIAALVALIAMPTARFFSEPRVEYVIYGLAVAAFVQGFENIGIVAFRKELALHKEFKFLLAKKLVGVIVGVTLAFILRSYWALVAGSIASRVAGVALSYLVHSFRPRLSLAARHELMSFSKWLFLNNILFVGIHRAPDFVIGRLGGPTMLGVYNLSSEIANLPTSELAAPVNRAVFPGYARMAGVQESLRTGFLGVVASMALLAIPAAAGLAALADLLVPVLLGSRWSECIPIIQILSVQGLLMALQTNQGYVFIATGKPSTATRLAMWRLVILVPSLVVGASLDGSKGAAWAALATVLVMSPFSQVAIFRALNLRLKDYGPILWRPLLGVGCMLLTIVLWRQWLDALAPPGGQLTILLTSVLIGATSYAAAVLLLWHVAGRPIGPESHAIVMVTAKLRRARPAEEGASAK
jgi:O-antigen/teichoic acid export membrane protein